jgi:AraC-like DNA-binding protein
MIRTILLLSPVFISLFWAIILGSNKKHHTIPGEFLSKFMILALICFINHFLYFAPLPAIYIYIDFMYQYAGSLLLPVYYIYFRLLTIDEKFSIKNHILFLTIPAVLATIYCVAAILAPSIEYKTWLFNENAFPDSPYIQFLGVMRLILRIQFLLQVVLTVIGNSLLIRKYGSRAEQFYSDLNDGKYNNARMLNYSIIIICCTSFLAVALGRHLLMPKETIIYMVWSISTVMMYMIGYMGFKQKPINPTFDPVMMNDNPSGEDSLLAGSRLRIIQSLLVLFEEKNIYLNSQLNIMDIVQEVGTNRTYVSSIINQKYHQNFCSFVNGYRVEELKRHILENPDFNNDILAQLCGFGSEISMKRAVHAKTGMSVNEYKALIRNKPQSNQYLNIPGYNDIAGQRK